MMLIPDSFVSPSITLEKSLLDTLPQQNVTAALEMVTTLALPDNLADLSGIIVRVTEILVIDNKRKNIFGGDPPADIYPIILVANGKSQEPVTFSLPGMFSGIKDGDKLPITAPGIAVTRNFNGLPDFLDIHVLLMRSREKARNFAQGLSDALSSDEGKSILSTLSTVITAANPGAGVALNISTSLLQLVLKFLKAEKDVQIFYGVGSFEKNPGALGVGKNHIFEDDKEEFAKITIEIVGIPA